MLSARALICLAFLLAVVASCGGSGSTTVPSSAAGSGAPAGSAAPPATAGVPAAGRDAAGAEAPGSAGRASASSASGAGASSGAAGSAATPSAGNAAPPSAGAAGSAVPPSAGAAGSANPPTAGSAGSAGGASAAVSCASALLCDDFESSGAMPDASRWQVVTPDCMGDSMIDVDPMQAHSGTHSARVRASGGYCNHVFLQAKPSGALPDPLFVRFYVRFDKALTTSHVTFLAMEDASDKKNLRMGGQSEILMWNRESDDATLPELSPAGIALSQKPATQKWLCVEFQLSGADKSLHTWVDGQAVAGLQVEGDGTPDIDAQWRRMANWSPKPTNLKLGWESYGSDANTLWFDDVALAGSRIGCSP